MHRDERPTKRLKTSGIGRIFDLIEAHDSFVSLESKLSATSSNQNGHVNNLCKKVEEATKRLLSQYEQEMQSLSAEVGNFLCELDDRKHDEDLVKGLIEKCPNALTHRNNNGHIPVQHLLYESAQGYSFVPLLATEGRRLNVFTKTERGGLNNQTEDEMTFEGIFHSYVQPDCDELLRQRLGIDNIEYENRMSDENDLELQALVQETYTIENEKRTKVLQELFHLGLFEKKDIIDLRMIHSASSTPGLTRAFHFLLNLCPESLCKRDFCNRLPIEFHARFDDREGFHALLKAGIQYYPRKLGFLLDKNPDTNKTPIEVAMSDEPRHLQLSPGNIFKMIHDAIPPSENYPILHDVIRLSPKFFSLFWMHYPDAIYLRDKKGRLPLHVALKTTAKWSLPLVSLIAVNNPIDRHEKDPVNGLYPFMSAASGRSNDLNVIYYLLRRDPTAWEGFRVKADVAT